MKNEATVLGRPTIRDSTKSAKCHNHKGHKGTRRNRARFTPLCTFVSFVVYASGCYFDTAAKSSECISD